MVTKRDIKSRMDVELLVNDFYRKVRKDETIGVIFNEVVAIDWDHHIPLIVDFWETMLLDAGLYQKNAMQPHFDINRKFPLKPVHFQKWLELFTGTVQEHFEGPTADMAITKAKNIAGLMQYKMQEINKTRT